MPSTEIQWFPGHMAKTRRLISENLKNVDAVLELLDARIPYSSQNPEIRRIIGDKPTLILLNKSGLADPEKTKLFAEKMRSDTVRCLETDCIDGKGIRNILPALEELLADKIDRYEAKGMAGRSLKVMVVGIPNVGKSSLINRISVGKSAKVENRPGVTRDKQWVTTNIGLLLMDMPGILWPKFDEKKVGENLALTGAVKDTVLDTESLACVGVNRLRALYPEKLRERYKITEDIQTLTDYELLTLIGEKRGFKVRGGEIDTERTALTFLDELRSGKIGRLTLDVVYPSEKKKEVPSGVSPC